MDRSEWLKRMRAQSEALYDNIAPGYWVTYGFYPNATHREFIAKLLSHLPVPSDILDAGCGAGRYDGMLAEPGHRVLGVDQSGRMLARAREHFPQEQFPNLRYEKIGLQEISFQDKFDAALCMDAMEHVSPEDWPGIVTRLASALKPEGLLYFTVEVPDWDEVRVSFEKAKAMGLPVVFGEIADQVDVGLADIEGRDPNTVPGGQADSAVYHYHPSEEQVRTWLSQAVLAVEEEGEGDGYWHLLVRKRVQ